MGRNDADDRYTETLRESVRAGMSGLVALAPIPVLSVLGAPVGIVLAYLIFLVVILATLAILRRRSSAPE